VDAELRTGLPGTDMIEEPLKICSSICPADGSPGMPGLSLRRVEFSVFFGAAVFSVLLLCRLIASKTLPIESPHQLVHLTPMALDHLNQFVLTPNASDHVSHLLYAEGVRHFQG
jgi:hypothetical protein